MKNLNDNITLIATNNKNEQLEIPSTYRILLESNEYEILLDYVFMELSIEETISERDLGEYKIIGIK